jgi:hypothetical protein
MQFGDRQARGKSENWRETVTKTTMCQTAPIKKAPVGAFFIDF